MMGVNVKTFINKLDDNKPEDYCGAYGRLKIKTVPQSLAQGALLNPLRLLRGYGGFEARRRCTRAVGGGL